jgi:DNA polymerase-3 subunit beta
METSVQRLRYVLQVLEPSVGGKTLPILKNVVVGQGRAYATNLETSVTVEMPEATDDPVLLPHQQVLNLLKHIPGAMRLTINREGQAIKLVAGATSAEFPVPEEVSDFPPLPVLQPIGEGQVDGDLFLKTATAIAEYAAINDSRPSLRCVCIALGDPIVMVGADGFRLAWQTVPIKVAAPDGMGQLLLPTTAVRALARVWKLMEKQPTVDTPGGLDPLKEDGSFRMAMLAVAKRMATIKFTPAVLSFHHGAVTIQTQLTQGGFPDYRQLIPTDLPHKVTFDAEEALRAVRSLADIAAEGSRIVRLEWSGDRLMLSARSKEAGTMGTSMCAHIQGEEGKIAFNIRYLGDYLAGKLGMVLMETSTTSSSARFYHSGSPDALLMPMFVQWAGDPAAGPAAEAAADGEAPEELTYGQETPVAEEIPAEPAAAPKRPRAGPGQKGEVIMETTCDYCRDPLEPGEGEFSWTCINPECQAKYEVQEGRVVLISAPIDEQ